MANPGVDVVNESPGRQTEPALEYTPRYGAGGPVTVRGIRLLVVLTLVNTTLLGMSVLGPQLFPFFRQQWRQWQASRAQARATQAGIALQQQCLNHSAAGDKVAYEEDPAEVEKLTSANSIDYGRIDAGRNVGEPPGWVSPVQATIPSYFPQYADAVFGSRVTGLNEPLLFLHGRTTSGGAQYIVSVHLSVATRFQRSTKDSGEVVFTQSKQRMLRASAWPAGSAGPSAARGKVQSTEMELVVPDHRRREVARLPVEGTIDTTAVIDYGHLLRIYEGQPDPADPSHFTIRYRLGREGVIHGWMKDDGVKLVPGDGQWSFSGPRQAWRPPGGTQPATQPALSEPARGVQPQSSP